MSVVELLDMDQVACCDEYVVTFLDENVVTLLDRKNKDYFDVGFLLPHLLEYILEETFGGQCIVHHGYMKKFG